MLIYNHSQDIAARYRVGLLNPSTLPETVLPIVDHIAQHTPDIVIGCDRGARLLGIAVFAAWNHTYWRHSGKKFPTLDHKLHFARISSGDRQSSFDARLDTIIDTSLQAADKDIENLRMLFVDDWSVHGSTRQLAVDRLADRGIVDSTWAVIGGTHADIRCMPHFPPVASFFVPWRDNINQIGIQYQSNMNHEGDSVSAAVPVHSKAARRNRQAIFAAAKNLATRDHYFLEAMQFQTLHTEEDDPTIRTGAA